MEKDKNKFTKLEEQGIPQLFLMFEDEEYGVFFPEFDYYHEIQFDKKFKEDQLNINPEEIEKAKLDLYKKFFSKKKNVTNTDTTNYVDTFENEIIFQHEADLYKKIIEDEIGSIKEENLKKS